METLSMGNICCIPWQRIYEIMKIKLELSRDEMVERRWYYSTCLELSNSRYARVMYMRNAHVSLINTNVNFFQINPRKMKF